MQSAQRVVFAVAARCSKLAQIGTSASTCNVIIASQGVFELHATRNVARWRLGHVLSQSSAVPELSAFQQVRGFASLKELTMPALSPTMTQGDLVEWKKKEGESLAPGDVIATVETDKATLEWESQEDGFLAKILVPSNSKEVKVGSVVALVADDEADLAAAAEYVPGGKAATAAAAQPPPSPTSSAGSFPPHALLKMPALSPTMNAGDIASWHKSVGDSVAPGDVLCDVGTDKATMAWEAQEEGFLAAIFKGSGSKDIQVGDPVALIVEDESAVASFAGVTLDQLSGSQSSQPAAPTPTPASAPPPSIAAAPPPPPAASQAAKPSPTPASGDRVSASPLAKKLARDAGVDLKTIAGSGPGGRIVASDVENAIARGPAPVSTPARAPAAAAYTDVELNQIKRVTAKRLLESKQTIPHYYLTMECNIDQLLLLRKQVNAQCEKLGLPTKISVTDLLIKAAALSLKKVPSVNASWMGDFIRQYNIVDISVAVMTPAGLMVPVVRSADKLGVQDISSSVKTLAQKAKENKLKPEEFSGGTFTISNLGMFGVKQFAAIVNPPQSAILAVGSPQKTVVLADAATQKFKEATLLEVTLSCDHRVVDGAVGAEWLQAFKAYVENPYGLVV